MAKSHTNPIRIATLAALVVYFAPQTADAFCGFYVGGENAELTNRATLVVMMRDGTHTVLSMRNHYEGPPEQFAMVVPVPAVLSEDDVNVLDSAVFDTVDTLASPRLVEYWEADPCDPSARRDAYDDVRLETEMVEATADSDGGWGGPPSVTIEAEFAVGEYDIVILSANDSSGLERWLRREGYHLPEGAGSALRPYVEAGTKFFVARVDPERVTWDGDHAVLSPLRVQYDSEQFNLPVRLGLINSDGEQDLVVHILARNQRFEAANYDNVTIPTNLLVRPNVNGQFASFYASLFDRVLDEHPGAVVTEYAWSAGSCDPCPGPVLSTADLVTLGLDVLGGDAYGWALTRLHYRYEQGSLGQDLVFREAEPLTGGRGTPDAEGEISREVASAQSNNFQGRYIVLHRWEGELECEEPMRGRWAGPPEGPQAQASTGHAYADRSRGLEGFVTGDIPELGVYTSSAGDSVSLNYGGGRLGGGGCGSCGRGTGSYVLGHFALFPLLIMLGARLRRRR